MIENQPRLSWALASLALLAAASAASATTYVRMSDEALAADSAVIIDGTVLERFERGDARTSYWVRVNEVLKGVAGADRILVRVPGGAGSRGTRYRVPGVPQFATGERAIFFLSERPDGSYGINQLGLGAFRRRVHRSGVWAQRDLGVGAALLDAAGATLPGSAAQADRRGWSPLLRRLRASRDGRRPGRVIAPTAVAAEAGFQSSDGVNAIVFNDPLNEVSGSFACGSGGVLAIGGSWTSSSHVFKGANFDTNVESEVITNDNTACFFAASQSNQAGVFAHELGHTLGLDHSDPTPSLMSSVYGGNSSLQQNDRDVIAYLYGAANPCLAANCALLGPSRWNVFPTPVTWVFESTGFDCAGGGLAAFQSALATWNDDANATIAYVYGGVVPPIAGSCSQPAVPNAPSNLIATAVSSSQINLSWTDASTNEASFRIERFNGSVFVEIGSTGSNQTSFADTGRSPSTLYTYRVRARNASGDSGYSLQASATTLAAASPPTAPTNLVAAALSASSIQLTWNDASSDETSFRVEQLVGFSFFEIAFTGASQSAYVVTGLSPSTLATFRVRARNGNGDSGYTNEASATTLAGGSPPAAPTNLAASALSATSIQLVWSDNATNETNYLAEIDATVNGLDDFQQLSPLLAANSTGATISNLLPATPYRFRVKALGGNGDSPYSNVAQATTQPATGPAPAAPANLAALALSPTAIQLTWTDASDNEDSFRVEREGFGSFVEVGSTPAGQASFTDDGLSPFTLYTYRVRARNGNGDSLFSNTASATTLTDGGGPTTPAAPEGLAAVALPNGHVVLTWADRSSDEDSFVLEHEEATGFEALLTLSANQQVADVPGLAAGRVHHFRLKAHNAAGDSPYSNVAAVALPAPAPPPGAWLETAEIRGFRFKTRIDGERQGTQVLDCVPDTLCVAGAIPSRTEVFLRVIGPRPNGKLWAQVVRFTVSRVEVWIEQGPGGDLRYYDLPALPASTSVLSGLNDSQAFAPAEGDAQSIDELVWRDLAELRHHQVLPAAAVSGGTGDEADPPPPAGNWLSTSQLPGFRFQARIGEGSAQRPATPVLDCVPQTLCLAGSLPDRTELFVRIIGPRPNGFLWAQLVRFTVSPVELWIEQTATHLVRYYRLDKLAASSAELRGRNDSEAFVP